jgi:hypothetical protein
MKSKKSTSNVLALFICSLCCALYAANTLAEQKSEATPEKVIIKKPIALTKQHKDDLRHYIANEQVKPLLAGPDEYLTLIKKNTTANSKGVVILLPEWQQVATNPKAINFLRNALPEHGWSTITVQPNNKPEGYPSTAITVAEQKKENELTLESYKMKLSTLLNAVMNTAKEYPGIVLVVAQGNNAAFLVNLYNQETSPLPNALIMLSSYRQSNHGLINAVNEDFSRELAFLELPVLDLYLKYDNPTVLAKVAQRQSIVKQEMKVYYRQRQLNNTTAGYYPEKELLSQINSWLKAIGW